MSGVSSATILSGVSAASGVMGTIGAVNTGNAKSSADTFNANIAGQNIDLTNQQTNLSLQQQQRDAYQKLGAIKAGFGASGVTSDSGSVLDVLADSSTQAQLDADTIVNNGKIKAAGYQNTENLDRAAASNDETSGYINGASAALLGATNTYKAYDTVGTHG